MSTRRRKPTSSVAAGGLTLERLTAGKVAQLRQIESTAGAAPWVVEVEVAALGPVTAQLLMRNDARVFLARLDGQVVGVCAYCSDKRWPGSAKYLPFLVVDARHRGRGIGRRVLEELIEKTLASGVQYAIWMVHNENAPMLKVSRDVAGGSQPNGDYTLFMHP